jgi:hypothetical protein
MRWLEFDIPNRHYSIPSLELLIRCAAESRWVRVHYRSETRSRWLELLPLRIYTSHGFWYCEAYSPEHQEERTFRVDRMSGFAELEQPATGVTARGAGGATGKGHSGTAARTDAVEQRAIPQLAKLDAWLRKPGSIELDVDAEGYVQKVLDIAPSPDSYARKFVSEEMLTLHLDALIARQQEDGGWPINWVTVSPVVEWEWRGYLAVERLKTLRAYGRL